MDLEQLFEDIYYEAILLREAKNFKDSESIISAIKDGTMVKLLNGKKNLPEWLKSDIENNKNIEEISNCFNNVLRSISTNINNGINETICFLIKKSSSLAEMQRIVSESLDALTAYSLSIKSQWVKNLDIMRKVEQEPYDKELWHNMEKELLDARADKKAKKHKTLTSTESLYDTLYEDETWGLYRPLSQTGDSELASHMEPFEYEGKIHYKARWCTAACNNFYDNYTRNGNHFYVFKHFVNGKYTDAWQLSFTDPTCVDFMDKYDQREYQYVLDTAPEELLKKVVCDNDISNSTLFDYIQMSKKVDIDIDEYFSCIYPEEILNYLSSRGYFDIEDYTRYEYDRLIEEGQLLDTISFDTYCKQSGKCIKYSKLLKKYNIDPSVISYYVYDDALEDAYNNGVDFNWDEYLDLYTSSKKHIPVEEATKYGLKVVKLWYELFDKIDKNSKEIPSLERYYYLYKHTDFKKYLEAIVEGVREGKIKNIPINYLIECYFGGMDISLAIQYFEDITAGRCPLIDNKGRNPIICYQNFKKKDTLGQVAQDIEAGLLPKNIIPEIYSKYNRKDVLEFFDLAKKGAFDSTATLDQFIEYGAQNLNDINVLKHQGRLGPTFTIDDCFRLGADKALQISKEMYDNNFSKNATLEHYWQFKHKQSA